MEKFLNFIHENGNSEECRQLTAEWSKTVDGSLNVGTEGEKAVALIEQSSPETQGRRK